MGLPGRVARGAAVFAIVILCTAAARADDPEFFSFGGGVYDFNQRDDEAPEFRIEYRGEKAIWFLKPFASVAATTEGTFFLHAGLLVDIYLGRRLVLTWSEAPGFWVQGASDKDLGHPLEFRSQIELGFRFDDRSRLSVAFSHVSNAGLGDFNPGAESWMLYYTMPVDKLFWR